MLNCLPFMDTLVNPVSLVFASSLCFSIAEKIPAGDVLDAGQGRGEPHLGAHRDRGGEADLVQPVVHAHHRVGHPQHAAEQRHQHAAFGVARQVPGPLGQGKIVDGRRLDIAGAQRPRGVDRTGVTFPCLLRSCACRRTGDRAFDRSGVQEACLRRRCRWESYQR